MPKNTWEAKISHGFSSVGKPAMLLLASVSTGYLLRVHGQHTEQAGSKDRDRQGSTSTAQG